MQLCSVEYMLNTSLTFFLSKLDSLVIKTLERIRFSSNQKIREGESNFDEKNVEEVFNLCSTEQSCINIGITCYKIGTLVPLFFQILYLLVQNPQKQPLCAKTYLQEKF